MFYFGNKNEERSLIINLQAKSRKSDRGNITEWGVCMLPKRQQIYFTSNFWFLRSSWLFDTIFWFFRSLLTFSTSSPNCYSQPLLSSLALCLRWFPCFALSIPTAHDFCVISARSWAQCTYKTKRSPSNYPWMLDNLINAPFLLNKHGNPHVFIL